MFDLSKVWIDYQCPNCDYQDEIQLIDAKSEKVVFCHNCKIQIQFQDSDASVHTGIATINKAAEELANIFKKLR